MLAAEVEGIGGLEVRQRMKPHVQRLSGTGNHPWTNTTSMQLKFGSRSRYWQILTKEQSPMTVERWRRQMQWQREPIDPVTHEQIIRISKAVTRKIAYLDTNLGSFRDKSAWPAPPMRRLVVSVAGA